MSDQLNLDTKALDELQAGLLKLGGLGSKTALKYGLLMAEARNEEERSQIASELYSRIQSIKEWFQGFAPWWEELTSSQLEINDDSDAEGRT